jgi:hypothetical protein
MLFYLNLSIYSLIMDISRPPFDLLLQFASFLGSGSGHLSFIIIDYLFFRGIRTQIDAYSDYFLVYSDFCRAYSDHLPTYSDYFTIYSDYFTIPSQFNPPICFICKKTKTIQPHSTNTKKNTPSHYSQGCPNKYIDQTLLHHNEKID